MKRVTLIRMVLLILLLALAWQGWPQRLDVQLGQAQTIFQTNAGAFPVTITLIPNGNDNGTVQLEIRSHDQLVAILHSQYNYDFFANQPAGWIRHTWLDSDWRQDVLLTLSVQDKQHYISSLDGKLH